VAKRDQVSEHLARFDELDFEAFNKQDWDLFNEIHDEDVRVVFPDGHETHGIGQHDKDMRAMFAWAPDMLITKHPVSFGSGDWTATTGTLEGTFTESMKMPGGKTVPPTGRHFRVPMATIARWADGRIAEENLFWDNQAIMQQLGVVP
jgi:ketosteroid isomerase-like protein